MAANLDGSQSLQLEIKFETEGNALDANTYASVLKDAAILVEEAGIETGSMTKLGLSVQAERPGSFVTLLSVSIGESPLFQPDAVKAGALALATAIAALKLWRDLKKLTPKSHREEGTEIAIETEEGEVLKTSRPVFDMVSSNIRAKKALEDAFKSLEKNASIKQVAVLDGGTQPVIEIPRNEFKNLGGKAPELLPESPTQITDDTAVVTVVKISFDPALVWEIVYRGDKRSAYVRDQKFWKDVKNRDIPFLDGDQLRANLKIPQKWSEEFRAYINAGPIDIVEVIEVIHHDPEPTLF